MNIHRNFFIDVISDLFLFNLRMFRSTFRLAGLSCPGPSKLALRNAFCKGVLPKVGKGILSGFADSMGRLDIPSKEGGESGDNDNGCKMFGTIGSNGNVGIKGGITGGRIGRRIGGSKTGGGKIGSGGNNGDRERLIEDFEPE